jgi:hypothetical protein
MRNKGKWRTRKRGSPRQRGQKFLLQGNPKVEARIRAIRARSRFGGKSVQTSLSIEPWQMTKEQWKLAKGYEAFWAFRDYSPSQWAMMSERTKRQIEEQHRQEFEKNNKILAEHRNAVIQAYFEGKPVPKEVLRNYADDIEDIKKRRLAERRLQAKRMRPARMTLDDLGKLKRMLGAERVIKSWHNKHVDKTGNFGYVVVQKGKSFQVVGEHDQEGEIQELKIVTYGGTDFLEIDKSKTIGEATAIMKRYIEKRLT